MCASTTDDGDFITKFDTVRGDAAAVLLSNEDSSARKVGNGLTGKVVQRGNVFILTLSLSDQTSMLASTRRRCAEKAPSWLISRDCCSRRFVLLAAG